jgi:hypothetical protein
MYMYMQRDVYLKMHFIKLWAIVSFYAVGRTWLFWLDPQSLCLAWLQNWLAVTFTVSKLAIVVAMGRTVFTVDDEMMLASNLRLGCVMKKC